MSTSIESGIDSAGHMTSSVWVTMLTAPPRFTPGEAPGAPPRAGAGKSLAARPREGEGVLVTRAGGRVRVDAIGRAAHRVLGGMVLGEPIGDAAAAAARLYPDDPVAYAVALLVETSAIARFQWKGHRQ